MRSDTALAIELMTRFADRTGLTSQREHRRYLWTDAFAVCNYLALDRATGERRYLELALRLVEQVHATLGRHRPDDSRRGWISGLADREGEAHPTRGGLRIGKELPERAPDEPLDDELEWERDGQYFHYLTKWMLALDRVAHATKQPLFAGLARELAVTAHRKFTYAPGPGVAKRMYWKMSIDLSRPLVASMGQHDPLDGLITCLELEATARTLGAPVDLELVRARDDFAAMVVPDQLATTDPLGLGGLLVDAQRLARVGRDGAWGALRDALLAAAGFGLQRYVRTTEWRQRAERRLAFRELGLAIGLACVESDAKLGPLATFGHEITAFWSVAEHRSADSWVAHQDINDVMLATSLLPGALGV